MAQEVSKATRARKPRNAREKIVKVALREFASRGLSGARVDRIALLAKTSKNMIYYHFGSKEGLYQDVMTTAYATIRQNETAVDVENLPPEQALRELVALSFDYHCKNELFVRLVMNENINRARHLKVSDELRSNNRLIIETLSTLLQKGEKEGVFKAGIDPVQLHLTISGLGFHFVSNRYTFGKVFEIDMESKEAIARRRDEVVETVISWCRI